MPVFIHDFTGIADFEDYYKDSDFRILDERDIEGTRGYLDPEAGSKLMEQIRNESLLLAFHFLDSGNYHYMTRLYASLINVSYDLIVYDNHTDMQESAFGDILSCGSWIADLFRYDLSLPASLLRNVVLIGAKKEYIDNLNGNYDKRVIFADSYKEASKGGCIADDLPVYLSIDKDVLSESEFICDWDQGQMKLDGLIADIRNILDKRDIIGIDVCGEPEVGDPEAAHKSSEVNRKIIKGLLK